MSNFELEVTLVSQSLCQWIWQILPSLKSFVDMGIGDGYIFVIGKLVRLNSRYLLYETFPGPSRH